ncbi:MAG: enolase C-terminal domain-like protein [Geminicoccaceae bacterium]
MTLTYDKVVVRPVLVPLGRPVVSRVGLFEEWPLILIDLHTKEGVIGRSYLEPYIAKSARYLVPMLEDLAAIFRNRPVAPVDDFKTGMNSLHLVGREGLSQIAVAGMDMAAWDALAKAANMPLCQLLGGSLGPVPAYNSNGLWLTPLKTLAKETKALVKEGGFSALKLRLGRETLADDIEAIRLVRKAAGDDVKLMCDFNQAQSLGDALDRSHGLDDHGLYWFEEPIVYDDFDGYAKLADDLKTPLQIGENFFGPRSMYRALQQKACDYVMPDLMRIGGVTGWMRAAALADAAGIQMSTHLYPEVSCHLMRATPTAHWLEWQDWANPIVKEPFEVKDSMIHPPDRPGNGLEWDEKAIKRYRMTI